MKNKLIDLNRMLWVTRSVVLMVLTLPWLTPGLAASQMQTGRYSSSSLAPTAAQINPLSAVVQVHFGVQVATVGEAITQLLATSGYQLAPKSQLSTEVLNTLKQSLPITVRQLGPITITNALLVLMGMQVFDLKVDIIKREVNFKLKSQFNIAGRKRYGA